ncbi:hypothetical protein [Microvirga aerophila]|nr:hypothetical protein [Microvirga aerophila]
MMNNIVPPGELTYAGLTSGVDDDLHAILMETIRDFLTERVITFTPRTYSMRGEDDLIGIIDGEFSLVELVDAIMASIADRAEDQ